MQNDMMIFDYRGQSLVSPAQQRNQCTSPRWIPPFCGYGLQWSLVGVFGREAVAWMRSEKGKVVLVIGGEIKSGEFC